MKYRNPIRLARIQKTNSFKIDQRYFFQVQCSWRFALLNLGLDLIDARNSKFATESNPPFEPFNPKGH